jgi:hypothetical protein
LLDEKIEDRKSRDTAPLIWQFSKSSILIKQGILNTYLQNQLC